jgi:hypothetical protein
VAKVAGSIPVGHPLISRVGKPKTREGKEPRCNHRDYLAEARTREALVVAMGTAISAVIAQDARGFFEHSGYRLQIP